MIVLKAIRRPIVSFVQEVSSRFFDASLLPIYEIAHEFQTKGELPQNQYTKSPDVDLIAVGYDLWQARTLIYKTDRYGEGRWCSSRSDRMIKPIHVSQLDPHMPLRNPCCIRVVYG